MSETQQGHFADILKQKNYLIIHHNDKEKYLDDFFEVLNAIWDLKFKGVNPLIANELQRLNIKVHYKSPEKIKLIFDSILANNRIHRGIWPLATVSMASGTFTANEQYIKEAVFPLLHLNTCKERGEFSGEIIYWGNETKEHKHKYLRIFTSEHKSYKNKLEKGLTEVAGRLKQKEPIVLASA